MKIEGTGRPSLPSGPDDNNVKPDEPDTSLGVGSTPDKFEAYKPDAGWLQDAVEAMKYSALDSAQDANVGDPRDAVECKISLTPNEEVEGKFLTPASAQPGRDSDSVECKISLNPGDSVEGKFLSPSEAVECKISLSESVECKISLAEKAPGSDADSVECKISLAPDAAKKKI